MKTLLKTFLFISAILIFNIASAQIDKSTQDFSQNNPPDFESMMEVPDSTVLSPSKHYIKLNVPSLAIGTVSLQYEFFATKSISIALAYKFTPNRGMIFKNQVIKIVEDAGDYGNLSSPGARFFEEFKFKNSTITPEVRFYLGQGYGKGFYLGPFIRFDNASFNTIYPFTGELLQHEIKFDGKLKSFAYGLNFGAQYPIGKHFTFDFFFGPYLSNIKIDFNSVSSFNISEEDAEQLRNELMDFKLPSGKTDITVTTNSVKAKLTSDAFPNLRFGLAFGYRF